MPEPSTALTSSASTGDAATGAVLIEVEVLSADLALPPTRRGVTLTGGAAQDVRDTLGTAIVESARVGGNAISAMESTYRLVPSEKTAQGLADGSLRWATAKKGDASVLVKNKETGRIAGNGDLLKVRPSPAKILGPAAWEAMAMATQQHYLVEINEKFEEVRKGVDEVLSRMDDDKLGTLSKVRKGVESSRERIAGGKGLSDARLEELHDDAQRANEVWHQLRTRMGRQLDEYRRGKATADDIERSWALMLHATQVLGESSALLTALPYDTVEALEEATSEERERVMHALDSVRELAGELHGEHLTWAALNADWHSRHTRNPARKAIRKVRGSALDKPDQGPIDHTTAWRASQIAAPLPAPAALLVTVHEDGTVEVAAEAA